MMMNLRYSKLNCAEVRFDDVKGKSKIIMSFSKKINFNLASQEGRYTLALGG